ncbi:hypothetical protein MKOR_04400 [Mycolicibacillus koreensis]|uniref:Uncharacterized protein n=2 Tax=Mycolicibacillus koreensis TaxID=1069220 RepID=A0A7I7SA73_9MYCO|nr:hypothetical protein B8W67_02295 [Mycolicibacillus koreensis]BBY53189.1 hypothetical protein MKOR_04400 [Mycolicibacillus koreensis]
MPDMATSVRSFAAAAVVVVAVATGLLWAPGPAGRELAPALPPAAADTPDTFAYPPLWPFNSQAEADRWRREGPTEQTAWHADAADTARRFTTDYLGFSEVDEVVETRESPTRPSMETWVTLGYPVPGHSPAPAATIHLARFGSTPEAPWQVVGTDDEVLTLDTPAYGSVAGPVIEAGGVITGVDECIHLQVRQSTQPQPLGEFSCAPAGGENSRWSARVTARGAQPGVLTLVASTGGHVTDVERFAVTAVRVGDADG